MTGFVISSLCWFGFLFVTRIYLLARDTSMKGPEKNGMALGVLTSAAWVGWAVWLLARGA